MGRQGVAASSPRWAIHIEFQHFLCFRGSFHLRVCECQSIVVRCVSVIVSDHPTIILHYQPSVVEPETGINLFAGRLYLASNFENV